MMTMADVADALKVSEKTVSRMLQDGSIPGFKIANQWRFYRDDFYRWIDEKRQDRRGTARAGLAAMLSDETGSVPLSRLSREDLIVTGIPAGPVESVLRTLAAPLETMVGDYGRFLDRLEDRERMMSTAVGGGIAIPHVRHPGDFPVQDPRLVIGSCPEGTDWHAFDGEPVRLFLLPLSGDELIHLRILSAVRQALAADGMAEALINANTPGELLGEILRQEMILQNKETT